MGHARLHLSLSLVAACALPGERTPLGDANALRRQAMARADGEGMDGVETALALVGPGATAVAVVSGGSSAVLKGGARSSAWRGGWARRAPG